MTGEAVWLDVAGAAARAAVSQQTILRAARRGQITAYKVGKLWRFRPADVDAFVMRAFTPVFVQARKSA
jgi:excisionase family DNA binding protein